MALNPKMAEAAKANPAMVEQMQKAMGAATISIGKDSLVAKGFKPKDDKATYKILSEKGNSMVIESKDEGKEEVEKMTVTFESDDKITLTKDGEDEKMPLKRK